jgi:hypothetical protein
MYENLVVFAITMAFFIIEIIYEMPIIQRCPYHMMGHLSQFIEILNYFYFNKIMKYVIINGSYASKA